jgi:glutamate N-acetyltransferase/amino-acid N-acetyltransferase
MNGVTLCRDGAVAGDRHAVDLSGRDILVEVDLHVGAGAAQVRTTDLSSGYVEENSAYSS